MAAMNRTSICAMAVWAESTIIIALAYRASALTDRTRRARHARRNGPMIGLARINPPTAPAEYPTARPRAAPATPSPDATRRMLAAVSTALSQRYILRLLEEVRTAAKQAFRKYTRPAPNSASDTQRSGQVRPGYP